MYLIPTGGSKQAEDDIRRICKNNAEALPDVLFIQALCVTCRDYNGERYSKDLQLLVKLESQNGLSDAGRNTNMPPGTVSRSLKTGRNY